MQTTTNIGLKTYEANDPTDWLGEFNYNMNKIDTAVGAQNYAIDVIEETAGTAVTTANTASATAEEALTTANTKASINDNVASATTTYSSNKIDDLISGAGGAVIDDTETSTTKTWSSSKINSEITALTQKHFKFIDNPDTNKYDYFDCYCVNKGNVLYISGNFRYKQAPIVPINDVLTLPADVKFFDAGNTFPNIAHGYITTPNSTYNDVIFKAVDGKIIMLFTDNFNYQQIDNTYTFSFSFTLMSDN